MISLKTLIILLEQITKLGCSLKMFLFLEFFLEGDWMMGKESHLELNIILGISLLLYE